MNLSRDVIRGYRCLNVWRVAALSAVLLLAGWLATPSQAQRREDPLAGLDSAQRRVFQNYTRLYCLQFFRFEDRFVLLPNYQRSRENSTGRSYDQAFEEMTKHEIVGLGKKVSTPPPVAEVIVSAKVIPAIDVGHYGFVNSVVVKEVLGPDEMIVGEIELIPLSEVGTKDNAIRKAAADRQKQYEKQTYRLLGFNTRDLRAGDKYFGPQKKGLQVAVMSTDPKHAFVLVNYDKLKNVRTNEFAEALAYVQMQPLTFIEMVRENRETLATEGDKVSLITIYRRYYNRYRPKRLSSTTRPPVAEPEPQPEPQPEPKPEPEARPEPMPEPEVRPQPKPEPRPEPKPVEEEEEDDWDYEEDTESAPDKPTFFGIPL